MSAAVSTCGIELSSEMRHEVLSGMWVITSHLRTGTPYRELSEDRLQAMLRKKQGMREDVLAHIKLRALVRGAMREINLIAAGERSSPQRHGALKILLHKLFLQRMR